MIELTKYYYYLFGVLTIIGGAIGYFKAGSTASIIAGTVCGALLIFAGVLIATKVQPALILCAKPAAAAYLLHLNLVIPVQLDARANRTSVARTAFQLEINPMTSRLDRVAIHQQWSALIRDDDIERASVAEIGERQQERRAAATKSPPAHRLTAWPRAR